MDPLWSETCWSTFKYFIILVVSTYYTLCISWIIKCLINTVFTSVIHALFLTKILYLNLGCVIYVRKRFYVNKSGYTGNFFKYCIKSVNYASKYGNCVLRTIYIVKSRHLKYLNKGLNKELKCSSLLIQLFFFTTAIRTPHVCQ